MEILNGIASMSSDLLTPIMTPGLDLPAHLLPGSKSASLLQDCHHRLG